MFLVPALFFTHFMSFAQPMSLTTNASGKIVIHVPREVVEAGFATELRWRGNANAALSICNGILSTNAANQWALLERMSDYGDLGQLENARRDFEELVSKLPEFTQAYNGMATILLEEPTPANGPPPILEWLKSGDDRKARAAKEIIKLQLDSIAQFGADWIASSDERKQRAAMTIIQTGMMVMRQERIGANK